MRCETQTGLAKFAKARNAKPVWPDLHTRTVGQISPWRQALAAVPFSCKAGSNICADGRLKLTFEAVLSAGTPNLSSEAHTTAQLGFKEKKVITSEGPRLAARILIPSSNPSRNQRDGEPFLVSSAWFPNRRDVLPNSELLSVSGASPANLLRASPNGARRIVGSSREHLRSPLKKLGAQPTRRSVKVPPCVELQTSSGCDARAFAVRCVAEV